jgi:hypothetical protein
MQWFRLHAEFAADPVVQSLAFEDQRHFVVLLCHKCGGLLDRKLPSDRRELIIARALGLDPTTAAEVKRRLVEVGLIDESWQPAAWDKRQFISDDSADRVRKHRKNKQTGNGDVTLQNRYGNGPETETETETETDKKDNAPRGADDIPKDFETWYSTYPLHKGRGQALKAYRTARKKSSAEELLAAATKYRNDNGRDPKFTKHPATWLHAECWLDEAVKEAPKIDPGRVFFDKASMVAKGIRSMKTTITREEINQMLTAGLITAVEAEAY